jgi:hypothetical protein
MTKRLLALPAGLGCLALLATPAPAFRLNPMALPVPLRVAAADAVVVGKVVAIEEKPALAAQFPGMQKSAYRVAVVQVDDGFGAAKGQTQVRVGYLPTPKPDPRVRPPVGFRPLFQQTQLDKGDEVVLFLQKHPDGNFYHAPNMGDAVKKGAMTYAKEVEEARKTAGLLADPKAGLTSTEQADRFVTAAMLINRYRTQKTQVRFGMEPKTEAIDAEESKLILTALAEADWVARPGPGAQAAPFMLQPLNLFTRLGVGPKDGWVPPRDGAFVQAAQKWVKDNASTYRIKKFVAE